jgi:hypothetical protein
LARRAHAVLAERSGWDEARLSMAMAPYWAEYDSIGIDAQAHSSEYFRLTENPGRWTIEQTLSDPAGDGEWRVVATVDLDVAMAEGAPTLRLEHLGPPNSGDA